MTSENIVKSSVPEFPVEFDHLPSKGKGYKESVKIFYRGYTVGELNKIATVRQDAVSFDFITRSVLDGVRVEGMSKLDLSYIDFLSIGLRRRVSSEGEIKFKMPYVCTECEKVTTLVFSNDDIKFNALAEKVTIEEKEIDVELPVTVTIKDVECDFWYPTVGNVLDAKSKKGKEPVTAIKAYSVRNLPFDEAYNLLLNLNESKDMDDLELLDIVDKALYHDIASIKSVCKNNVTDTETEQTKVCNHTNEVSIEGKELLIRPFRESKAPVGSKIRFGHKRDS